MPDLLMRQELFCPLDGKRLSKSKWEWCGDAVLTCPNNHLWDVGKHSYIAGGLQFEPIKFSRCSCGQAVPSREMKSVDGYAKGKLVCPDCFEVIKRAWKPDPEQSHARLVISPIRRGEEVIFRYEEEVEIRPYPNPYGCGGCWGMGGKKTKAEVEQLIEDFKSWNDEWVKLGVKLEVIRKPEMTAAEHINERITEQAEEEADQQLRLVA